MANEACSHRYSIELFLCNSRQISRVFCYDHEMPLQIWKKSRRRWNALMKQHVVSSEDLLAAWISRRRGRIGSRSQFRGKTF